jgi:hypothetical protein
MEAQTPQDWLRLIDFQDAALAHGAVLIDLLDRDCDWCNGLARIAIALADWDTATFRRVYRLYVQANG